MILTFLNSVMKYKLSSDFDEIQVRLEVPIIIFSFKSFNAFSRLYSVDELYDLSLFYLENYGSFSLGFKKYRPFPLENCLATLYLKKGLASYLSYA
jgi:hypothetical protein